MSDLISRSALLDRAYKCVTATAVLCVVDSYIIENAPAVDAVEVVRCSECRNLYVPFKCALHYGSVDGKDYFICAEDGFGCTKGERKDNG